MWKRGEIAKEQFLLFSTIFSVYLYFQESNSTFICEMWLFDLSFFLNSANLICRDTDISKYFRESLGLRDNESRLYIDEVTSFYIILLAAKLSNDLKSCIISSCKKKKKKKKDAVFCKCAKRHLKCVNYLTFNIVGKKFSRRHFEIFFLIFFVTKWSLPFDANCSSN